MKIFDERIEAIADHYGFESQTEKAIEEMGELIVSIKQMKKADANRLSFVAFLDELTDVKIMVEQLEHLSVKENKEAQDYLDRTYEYKLQRQIMRINENDIA